MNDRAVSFAVNLFLKTKQRVDYYITTLNSILCSKYILLFTFSLPTVFCVGEHVWGSVFACVCAHMETQGWGQESSLTTHFIYIIDWGRVSRANPALPSKVSFPVELACLCLPRLELQAGLHACLAFKWIPGDLNSGPMFAWQALHRWSISPDPVIPNNTHLSNVAQGGNSQWKTLGWLMCDSEPFSMSLNLGCCHDLLSPGKHEKSQSLPILPCSLSEQVLPLALLDPAFPWEQPRISLLKNEKSRRAKPRHVSHGHNQSHPSKTCQLTTNTFWAQIKEPHLTQIINISSLSQRRISKMELLLIHRDLCLLFCNTTVATANTARLLIPSLSVFHFPCLDTGTLKLYLS